MFHRMWSIRNLDILLLILLTPGLMLIYEGRKKSLIASDAAVSKIAPLLTQGTIPVRKKQLSKAEKPHYVSQAGATQPVVPLGSSNSLAEPKPDPWPGNRLEFWGFVWLLSVCGCLGLRMLLDTAMVRRPLLEPNLSSGGLTFIGVSLFLFLMANIVTSTAEDQRRNGGSLGPGYVLLNMLPGIETTPMEPPVSIATTAPVSKKKISSLVPVAIILAILANLVLVVGVVAIGYWHFSNIKTGIGVATLILLLPYTAQMSGEVEHVLPGALMVLAILLYRQPVASGWFLGCAAGLVYYPFFLLPLWLSYYWQRGSRRFTIGFLSALLCLSLALLIQDREHFLSNLQRMYGVFLPAVDGLGGAWGLGWHPYFRLPILVTFVMLCLSFIFWPAQKNLATLMSCSAAIMTLAQFWHGYGGGLYMAWFLPLVMLTVFRPNLDDRVALNVVRPMGRRRRVAEPPQSPPLAQAG